jgi:hypothetical protein
MILGGRWVEVRGAAWLHTKDERQDFVHGRSLTDCGFLLHPARPKVYRAPKAYRQPPHEEGNIVSSGLIVEVRGEAFQEIRTRSVAD